MTPKRVMTDTAGPSVAGDVVQWFSAFVALTGPGFNPQHCANTNQQWALGSVFVSLQGEGGFHL